MTRNYIKRSLFLFSLSVTFSLCAQDLPYAQKIVDTLASDFMHGRGYVKNGLQKAENYISTEFKNWKLIPFSENYLQSFSHPVNTFPGSVKIETEDKILSPGRDFIVSPFSVGFKGELEIVWLTDSTLNNRKKRKKFMAADHSKSVVIVDTISTGNHKKLNAKSALRKLKNPPPVVIFLTETKLTWGASSRQGEKTEITVLKNVINKRNNKIKFDIETEFIFDFTSNNIIGYIEGKEKPDSFIVFSAHYDHLGSMGKRTIFPGANDNASGISMLLNLAKYYSENPHRYSVVFIAFAGEELGLLGSGYYTNHPLFPLGKIKFLLNMDIMGTGDEGITVVNGSIYKEDFNSMVNINASKGYLKQVKARGKAMNSDHYFFSDKGVPAFFIYTMGGINAYHDINDRAETLPLSEFEDLFKLIVDFTGKL